MTPFPVSVLILLLRRAIVQGHPKVCIVRGSPSTASSSEVRSSPGQPKHGFPFTHFPSSSFCFTKTYESMTSLHGRKAANKILGHEELEAQTPKFLDEESGTWETMALKLIEPTTRGNLASSVVIKRTPACGTFCLQKKVLLSKNQHPSPHGQKSSRPPRRMASGCKQSS